jgi:hypothetical protein
MALFSEAASAKETFSSSGSVYSISEDAKETYSPTDAIAKVIYRYRNKPKSHITWEEIKNAENDFQGYQKCELSTSQKAKFQQWWHAFVKMKEPKRSSTCKVINKLCHAQSGIPLFLEDKENRGPGTLRFGTFVRQQLREFQTIFLVNMNHLL